MGILKIFLAIWKKIQICVLGDFNNDVLDIKNPITKRFADLLRSFELEDLLFDSLISNADPSLLKFFYFLKL